MFGVVVDLMINRPPRRRADAYEKKAMEHQCEERYSQSVSRAISQVFGQSQLKKKLFPFITFILWSCKGIIVLQELNSRISCTSISSHVVQFSSTKKTSRERHQNIAQFTH